MRQSPRLRKWTGLLLAVIMLFSQVLPVVAEVVLEEPTPLVEVSSAPPVEEVAPKAMADDTPPPVTPITATPLVSKAPVEATPVVTETPVEATPVVTNAPVEETPVMTETPDATETPVDSTPQVTASPAPEATEPMPHSTTPATDAPVSTQPSTEEPVVSQAPIANEEPGLTQEQESLVGVRLSVSNFNMMSRLINQNDIPNLYKVRIDYVNEAGAAVIEPYLAIIESGKSLTVTSPDVVGYTTALKTVEVTAIAQDFNQSVLYTVTPSTYQVRHLLESLDATSFDLQETETLSGVQGNLSEARAKKFDGFVEYPITQQVVLADNSTVVEVKYWRVTYTLNFSTTIEGSFAPAISKKFGAPIAVSEIPQNVTRPGYTFLGWDWNQDGLFTADDKAPLSMEAKNQTVHAVWQPALSSYLIIYWVQNPNDNNYTPFARLSQTAATGSLAAADYLSGSSASPYYYGKAIGAGNAHMTAAEFAETDYYLQQSKQNDVIIKADGSTTVNVYYLRRTYDILFKTENFSKEWWSGGIY